MKIFKEAFTAVLILFWMIITFLPMFGWTFSGDKPSVAITYAGINIALAILLK